MFGLLYTIFVGLCRTIQNAIELTDSEEQRRVAKEKGKTVYFDYRGTERLVSNNHRAASGVRDWKTGDVGIKDLQTFELVENWSENKRKNNELEKNELERKANLYNEKSKKDFLNRKANDYNGKPVWYPGKKVIFVKEMNKYILENTYYSLKNDKEGTGHGQDCLYDLHNIFILEHSLKTEEEIMRENETIINRNWSPSYHYIKYTNLGGINTTKDYFQTRQQLINYADQIGAPYRKDKITTEEYL